MLSVSMIALHTDDVAVREIFSQRPRLPSPRQRSGPSAGCPFSGGVLCPCLPDTLALPRLYHCSGRLPPATIGSCAVFYTPFFPLSSPFFHLFCFSREQNALFQGKITVFCYFHLLKQQSGAFFQPSCRGLSTVPAHMGRAHSAQNIPGGGGRRDTRRAPRSPGQCVRSGGRSSRSPPRRQRASPSPADRQRR